MRTIKFRAWDKTNGRMYPPFELTDYMSSNEPYQESLAPVSVELELMQFTGLLDKHGKEIYESDLVEWNTGRYLRIVEYKDERSTRALYLSGVSTVSRLLATSTNINIYPMGCNKNPRIKFECDFCGCRIFRQIQPL